MIKGPSASITGMGLIYDNLLVRSKENPGGYELKDLKRLTSLYALLYDNLAISDSWVITNPVFQEMVSARDGIELITQGIITPIRRDTVGSFSQFHSEALAKNMHGICAAPEFVKLLDTPQVQEKTEIFKISEIAANYRDLSQKVLSRDVMIAFGISASSAEIIEKRIQQAKDLNENWNNNTFIKDQVCPLLPEKDADLLMELARAPYSVNIPQVMGFGIIGPDNFRGDQILSALNATQRNVGTIGVSENVLDALFKSKIDDPLVAWLLSDSTLQTLSPEELVICRSPSERYEYLINLQVFLTEQSQKSWEALLKQLNLYLKKAAEDLFRFRRSKNAIISDPKDSDVVIEGGSDIRLNRPGKDVVLTGIQDLAAETRLPALSIVGKTVRI